MVAGLEKLIGNTVKAATIDIETCDLNLYFEEWDLRLAVWGKVSEDEDGYSLFIPGRSVSIDGPGRITSEVSGRG
ncbi:hypothetical protein Pan44_04500 [Caulifigura coniformis]|uniref:Uncharacterized protein n=1 Tax=Caulifigura coniformis TaxID=2527983 RepID=A0A517S8J1_9PLAN|nr:hypothetical protein [Caulifigura coniformis]QDT52439.1 hypothetical protein Pan44_04500 [Caulifigura coniformis]